MPGLLGDSFDDPRTSAIMALSGGLLRGDFGGGLLGANNAFAEAKQNAARQQYMQAQMQNMQAEAEARKLKAEQERLAMQRQQEIRAALPGLYRRPGLTGGEAAPQTFAGTDVPQFSRPAGVTPVQSTPGGFDVQAAIRLGMDPESIQKYAELQNVGRPKATRQMEVDDGNGGKRIALVDDFGREVAGFSGYTAPVQVQQGDRVSFVKPTPGVTLPVNMSPDARASNALGWANNALTRREQDMNDARAREAAAAGKVPAGFRMKPDGTMEAIPGGPADLKASVEGQKKVSEAKDVLTLLDEVDKLLPKATGSYLGAGVDQAARTFGFSTPGAVATGQLKALEGALISKMPKMSGPQSDRDVQLYRDSAGQVADATLPVEVRQAAARTLRGLNEKYAGMPEGSSSKNLVTDLPRAAPKGTRARDTATGKTLVFNGLQWVPEK